MSRESVISLSAIDKQGWKEGWDELLDSSPNKPLFHRVSYPPRISLNGILISLLSTVFLVFMGFILVSLPSPLEIMKLNQPNLTVDGLALIRYTFQIPVALMVGAFLGPFLGTASVLLFLLTGLFVYPVFANGGGWEYIFEPGFGYLAGTLIAAFLLGRNFHKIFQKENKTSRSLKLLSMTAAAIFIVHLAGIGYLTGLTVLGKIPVPDLFGWILRLSVETAPYDFLATFTCLCLVRQLRLGLWLVLY